MSLPHPLFDELSLALTKRPPARLGLLPSHTRRASVLIPVFVQGGVPHLLFVKRPEGDYHHAGQIAFPGGKQDDGESPLACALREALEEVGLKPEAATVLGELDEYDTVVTSYRVSPFVAAVPGDYPFLPDRREVERILRIPLPVLLDEAAHRVEERMAFGRVFPIHFYSAGPDVIWGVTGAILSPLVAILRTLPSCPKAPAPT